MPVRKQCPAKCGILCTFSLFSPSPRSFPTAPSLPSSHALCLFRSAHCPFRAPPHSFPAPPHTLLPCVLSRAPPHSFPRSATHSAPLRFVPRSSALSRAAAPMFGRIRRLPCRYVPARFVQPLHILSKEQNPCARGAGVSSHCHVMFRRRLTPERGRCKPAHRRRASWLQA